MKKIIPMLFAIAALALPARAANPGNVVSFTNIAAIQALGAGAPFYPEVSVLGYYTAGDGGGGVFDWNATSTATADGGTIIQATGVGTGRWIRQLPKTPQSLNVRFFGAKCDGSTDDSTALQNTENYAATNHVEVYYPASQCNFATGIAMGIGVLHRGSGRQNSVLQYTGTGWAFSLLLPNGTGIVQAPGFFDLQINTPNVGSSGGGIKYNDPTHGFTDDNTSQEYMWQPVVQRVYFNTIGTSINNGIGIQCSKCFNAVFDQDTINYYATAIDVEGSDGAAITNSALYYGNTQEILAQAHNTFGNFLTVSHNDMPGTNNGAAAYVTVNYRSAWIYNNHIENPSAVTTLIAATGQAGGLLSIQDNLIFSTSALSPCWFTYGGGLSLLSLQRNNENSGPTQPPACFGTNGMYYYSAQSRFMITAADNIGGDAGIPFTASTNQSEPAAPLLSSGQTVWNFTPNLKGLSNANAGVNIHVQSGAFVVPPSASPSVSTVQFQGDGNAPSLGPVDVWVCGYAGTNGQAPHFSDGSTNPSQAFTATNACYKVFSNDTFVGNTLVIANDDTVTNSNLFITQIKFLSH